MATQTKRDRPGRRSPLRSSTGPNGNSDKYTRLDFDANVKRSQYPGVSQGQCWIWQGAVNRQTGHGLVDRGPSDGKRQNWQHANRFAYEQAFGPIPSGCFLRSTCGTDLCVNPEHWEPATVTVRLWEKTAWGEVPEHVSHLGPCLIWTGAIGTNGYGHLQYHGRIVEAHRVAWELANGHPVPEGLEISHRCDNKLCILPLHLDAVTHAENMRLMGVSVRRRRAVARRKALSEVAA